MVLEGVSSWFPKRKDVTYFKRILRLPVKYAIIKEIYWRHPKAGKGPELDRFFV